jgi:hypothetical protein
MILNKLNLIKIMDLLEQLKQFHAEDCIINSVYNTNGYITFDIILMNKTERFDVKNLRYCNMSNLQFMN